MLEFSDFIFEMDSVDLLPLLGGTHTQSNNRIWSWTKASGRLIFLIFFKIDWIEFVRTISLLCWTIEALNEIKDTLSLKICGCKWMVLWIN